ncbi:MAG: DUF4920 domain-containing protein [Flavobacteriales bacterium]|nr:DUF4920 domain-containing protein [Flavobacteriales bacterium]
MRIFSILIGLLFLMSCAEQDGQNETSTTEVEENIETVEDMFFGEKIDESGAIGVEELYVQLEATDSVQVKLTSTINATCTKKGCWMTVDLGNENEMMVRFKDYGFFVPLEGMEGKTTVFEGFAFTDSISIEELRHYAEDAGEDSTAIAAITEAEVNLAFEASGVIIKN